MRGDIRGKIFSSSAYRIVRIRVGVGRILRCAVHLPRAGNQRMIIQENPTPNTMAYPNLVARVAFGTVPQIRGVIPDIVRRLYFLSTMIAVAIIGLIFRTAIRAEQMAFYLFSSSLPCVGHMLLPIELDLLYSSYEFPDQRYCGHVQIVFSEESGAKPHVMDGRKSGRRYCQPPVSAAHDQSALRCSDSHRIWGSLSLIHPA